jgi:hypothetical protein
MSTHIASPQELTETFVCETHTKVVADINTAIDNRYLWVGKNRQLLLALREFLEAVIAGDKDLPSQKTVASMYATALRN